MRGIDNGRRIARRKLRAALLAGTLSATAVPFAAAAQTAAPPTSEPDEETQTTPEDIVVTGIRESLERAAAIKRDAPQVVDSIVAEDIGRFPDVTTAAALQRVPGVQVTIAANNEVATPIVRGLSDILTTLDGREIFSFGGRGFAFRDIPSSALSRVDVIKSNTADLIEGGVAGAIDLQLNKAFDFNEPTFVLNARGSYAKNAESFNPQLGFLATDRWDTGIGEIGALVHMSYVYTQFNQQSSFVPRRRSTSAANTPQGAPGLLAPNDMNGFNEFGYFHRPEVDASLQWQATPELEFYADGLYTGYRSKWTAAFHAYQNFAGNLNPARGPVSRIVSAESDDTCYQTRVNAEGFNPNTIQLRNGNFTTPTLCNMVSATYSNVPGYIATLARDLTADAYLGAGGFRYEADRAKLNVDLSYQTSTSETELFQVDVGKTVPSLTLFTNVDGKGYGEFFAEGNPFASADGFAFTNGLVDNIDRSEGTLIAGKFDGSYEFDSVLKEIQFGFRYGDRDARLTGRRRGAPAPGGVFATPVASTGLGREVFDRAPGVPYINNGAPFLVFDRDYLLSDEGQDTIRGIYRVPLGPPQLDPTAEFNVNEKTYASYLQAAYDLPLGGGVSVDGLVGVRATKTDRQLAGTGRFFGVLTPLERETSDTDILPNASARVRFGGGLQARLTYAKTLSRPAFGDLNPALNLFRSQNIALPSTGSGGNPDLRPQKSDAYDATLEYFFPRGFVAVAGFYRDIKDRVFGSVVTEEIDGELFNISRPRNIAGVRLKGIEVSGQTFFDFLPGALAGFGVFGNFTYIDSEVNTPDDPLTGYPIINVSKYNANIALLYERKGLIGRISYIYRGRYYDGDQTGTIALRDIDDPVQLEFIRPTGRVDFFIGYDITDRVQVNFSGVNVTGENYRSYFNDPEFPNDIRVNDVTLALGTRIRF